MSFRMVVEYGGVLAAAIFGGAMFVTGIMAGVTAVELLAEMYGDLIALTTAFLTCLAGFIGAAATVWRVSE